jgi:hypothetical protein
MDRNITIGTNKRQKYKNFHIIWMVLILQHKIYNRAFLQLENYVQNVFHSFKYALHSFQLTVNLGILCFVK